MARKLVYESFEEDKIESLSLNPYVYEIEGLHNDWHFKVEIRFRGKGWVVCKAGYSLTPCSLSKSEKLFILESMPSDMTDEDYQDVRFDSKEEALSFFKECLKEILSLPETNYRVMTFKQELGLYHFEKENE